MRSRLDELVELAQEALRAVGDCDASTKARADALEDLENYAADLSVELAEAYDKEQEAAEAAEAALERERDPLEEE